MARHNKEHNNRVEDRLEDLGKRIAQIGVFIILSLTCWAGYTILENKDGVSTNRTQTREFQRGAHKNHDALWDAIAELRSHRHK